MPMITCEFCGDMVNKPHANYKYCSVSCRGKKQAAVYASNRFSLVCAVCGKEYQKPAHLRVRSKTCSELCRQKYAARIGGKIKGDILRFGGEGKTYIKLNGRHMHRVLMEKKIGRQLLPGETVHHLDGNKRNNTIDNLVLFASQAEHARLHNTKNRKCTIPGCGLKHFCKGLCRTHFYRNRRRRKSVSL